MRVSTAEAPAASGYRVTRPVRSETDGSSSWLGDAQRAWADTPVAERLRVVKQSRHGMAARAQAFAKAISPELARTEADSLVAEVLPLLEAARFLERNAVKILERRRLARRGLPWWLRGLKSEVERVPFGTVLVIGPANYPLFLPGVQALQGLVAGNAVIWKPGRGGLQAAHLFADCMRGAGLPRGLLRVTDESAEAAEREIEDGVDKVFFTGSAATGRVLLRQLAETLTPCVAELSGCDAMVVLPTADLGRVVKAIAFGMRLNGSAICMAPRRVLLVDAPEDRKRALVEMLARELSEIAPVALPQAVEQRLQSLLAEARGAGATLASATMVGELSAGRMTPLLVVDAKPEMEIAKADLFAPVVMLIDVAGEAGVVAAQQECPFGLTSSIFGDERHARRVAEKLAVGTVSINDVIVSTADPRMPFAGRRQSGFGVTRGAEGLLEMTAVRAIAVNRGLSARNYEATGDEHRELFSGVILASHGGSLRARVHGFLQLFASGRRLNRK